MYHVNHDHVYSRLSCYFLIYTKKIHCYHFIYKEECLWSRLYTDQSICYLFCSSMKDTWTCLTRCRFYTRCARHCIIFVMTFWNVQHSVSEQIKVVVIVLTILLFFFHYLDLHSCQNIRKIKIKNAFNAMFKKLE